MKKIISFLVTYFLKPSAEKIIDEIVPLIKQAFIDEMNNNKTKRYTYYPADIEKIAETVAKKVSIEVSQKAYDAIFSKITEPVKPVQI